MLRALQSGLRISDMKYLETGMVMDIITEAGNDNEKYQELASQADFDRF